MVCVQSPRSGGYELGNAHEIVGDEIEHKVGSDGCDTSVLCLAHRAVLLTPAEDALGHLSASLRDLIADVTGGARIDCAATPRAGLGEAVVNDLHGDNNKLGMQISLTERGNMVAGVGYTPNAHDVPARRWTAPHFRLARTAPAATGRAAPKAPPW